MITLQNYHYIYLGSDRENLNGMDLTIENGSFVLLCGPSGCGKTTLTRVLNGLIPHYYEGNVFRRGQTRREILPGSEPFCHFTEGGKCLSESENPVF